MGHGARCTTIAPAEWVDPIQFPEDEGGGFDRVPTAFVGPVAHVLHLSLDEAVLRWPMRGTADLYGPSPEMPCARVEVTDRDAMKILDDLRSQSKFGSRRFWIPASRRDKFRNAPMLEDGIAGLQSVLLFPVPE